jgi:hypothetical protein
LVVPEWHLNAVLMLGSAAAELGWSMRRAKIALALEDQI